jgi:DNA polymerase-3 subunit delta'
MKFSEVAGQDLIKEQLRNSIRNQKLSHSLLFIGPEGYGGLALALALAQYINCEQKENNDSCGLCSSCKKFKKLIHPDVHFSFPTVTDPKGKPSVSTSFYKEWRNALDENVYLNYYDWLQKITKESKQGNITVTECHAIIKNLSLKSFEGGYKIQIIWYADLLGNNGNALLKIIEEPPEKTLFVFIAKNKDHILNTILSRSQQFQLSPVSSEAMQSALTQNYGVEENEAARIATMANGDFATAIRLSKKDDNDHEEEFIKWMRMCFELNPIELYKWTNNIGSNGREYIKDFLHYANRMIRECVIFNQQAQKINSLSDSELAFVEKFAQFIMDDKAYRLYHLMSKTHYYVERNANLKIIFFNLSLQIHKLLKQA